MDTTWRMVYIRSIQCSSKRLVRQQMKEGNILKELMSLQERTLRGVFPVFNNDDILLEILVVCGQKKGLEW